MEISIISDHKTFAYIILSCSRVKVLPDEIRADWSDCSGGDILECFISLEGQADAGVDIWPFDWRENMDRIAPAQLTLGWDPREYLLNLFEEAGTTPSYKVGNCSSNGYQPIIYINQPPAHLPKNLSPTEQLPNPLDKTRLEQILEATIELARSQNRGVLFICDQGWDYNIDAEHMDDEAIKVALEEQGMKFFTSHA